MGRKDWLGYYPWVVAIDLKSGEASHPFQNPVQGRVEMTAGPCREGAPGVPPERCAALPSRWHVEFDLDDEGRIGFHDYRRIGLLLLDGSGSRSSDGKSEFRPESH